MDREGRSVGRYVLYDRIASGGMAQVHLGRLVGAVGFSRTVAIKRLLPHCATDAEIVPMFVDEARLAARIRHPNVVGTLDVVQEGDELLLVMEYVHGESLARLVSRARTRGIPVPPSIAVAIGISMLEGLHAAHEARSERGEPLGIVHRDVSPQNVIIGADGVARVVDFGIAKARGRIQTTRDGQLKGKAGYIAPEQLRDTGLDRRVDVYAAAVVLWEVLAGRRLFEGDGAPAVMRSVLEQRVEPPSHFAATAIPRSLDDVIMRGLARTPADRFDTAREMAVALEHTMTPASAREIERWVESLAAEVLASRAALLAAIESDSARVFTDGKAHLRGNLARTPARAPAWQAERRRCDDPDLFHGVSRRGRRVDRCPRPPARASVAGGPHVRPVDRRRGAALWRALRVRARPGRLSARGGDPRRAGRATVGPRRRRAVTVAVTGARRRAVAHARLRGERPVSVRDGRGAAASGDGREARSASEGGQGPGLSGSVYPCSRRN